MSPGQSMIASCIRNRKTARQKPAAAPRLPPPAPEISALRQSHAHLGPKHAPTYLRPASNHIARAVTPRLKPLHQRHKAPGPPTPIPTIRQRAQRQLHQVALAVTTSGPPPCIPGSPSQRVESSADQPKKRRATTHTSASPSCGAPHTSTEVINNFPSTTAKIRDNYLTIGTLRQRISGARAAHRATHPGIRPSLRSPQTLTPAPQQLNARPARTFQRGHINASR